MPVTKIRREQLKLTLQDLIYLNDESGGSRTVDLSFDGLTLNTATCSYKFAIDGLYLGSGGNDYIKISDTSVLWKSGTNWIEFVKDIVAGAGISVSRSGGSITVTNSDRGSSQAIFKNIKLGTSTATASSNNDTFEFVAGTGIGLSLDTTNKKLTISHALTAGTGISISGATISINLSAGTGITISGNTISVSDYNFFKNIANSSGTVQFSASGVSTLRFGAGGILSVTFDSTNRAVTYSASLTAGTGISVSGSTISVASPTARTDTAQTWTATQTFNNGIVIPSSARKYANLGFDVVFIEPSHFSGATGPTRYKSWSGTTGFKFEFASNKQILVFLNGQLLKLGSFNTSGWLDGDYAWETDSSGDGNFTKVLALREQPVTGDLITVVGLFDSIFY